MTSSTPYSSYFKRQGTGWKILCCFYFPLKWCYHFYFLDLYMQYIFFVLRCYGNRKQRWNCGTNVPLGENAVISPLFQRRIKELTKWQIRTSSNFNRTYKFEVETKVFTWLDLIIWSKYLVFEIKEQSDLNDVRHLFVKADL